MWKFCHAKNQPPAQHHLRLSSKENDILNPAIPPSWTAALPDLIKWGKEIRFLQKATILKVFLGYMVH